LIELGFNQVFPHVGQNTQVEVQGRLVWPMVTGTFGGVDFIHSLLGDAADHISQTSLADLNAAITEAQSQDSQDLFGKLRMLINLVPGATSDLDKMQQNSKNMASQGDSFYLQGTLGIGVAITAEEIAGLIYPLLSLRDRIMKSVSTAIEKVSSFSSATD
jgi:Heterokaryon incompatibility protein Het-C